MAANGKAGAVACLEVEFDVTHTKPACPALDRTPLPLVRERESRRASYAENQLLATTKTVT